MSVDMEVGVAGASWSERYGEAVVVLQNIPIGQTSRVYAAVLTIVTLQCSFLSF